MKNNKGGGGGGGGGLINFLLLKREGLLQRGAVFEGRGGGGCLIEDLRYDTTWLGRYCVFSNKHAPTRFQHERGPYLN